MGILFRDGRYILRWTDGKGRRRFRASKAETKTEAKRLLRELERQAERQRFGIDPLPSDTTMTLAEVCQWWLDHRCPKASVETERLRLGRHVLTRPIGRLSLPRVTSERVEALLVDLEKAGASPASVNKLRSVLHTVFSRARKAQLWVGNNPIADVATRRVPKRAYVTLCADEVPTLLSHVDEEWRNLFAAALYTGLRKGELCGLLKTDVDFPNRTLTVARSYDRNTTKGGHVDAIPIAEALVPYLEDAIARSPSVWVFPSPDGSMRTEQSDPQKVLRTALARAGMVEGYEHVCRRCKARGRSGHTTRHPDSALRRCGQCGMKLWPRALPRRMRFHDLRHATATLLLRAGVDPHRVQRILRHTDIRVTLGTYGHLQVEDLRDAVNRIAPQTRGLELDSGEMEPKSGANLAPHGEFSVQATKPATARAPADLENLREIRALQSGRSRFRTCDPCRVKQYPYAGRPWRFMALSRFESPRCAVGPAL